MSLLLLTGLIANAHAHTNLCDVNINQPIITQNYYDYSVQFSRLCPNYIYEFDNIYMTQSFIVDYEYSNNVSFRVYQNDKYIGECEKNTTCSKKFNIKDDGSTITFLMNSYEFSHGLKYHTITTAYAHRYEHRNGYKIPMINNISTQEYSSNYEFYSIMPFTENISIEFQSKYNVLFELFYAGNSIFKTNTTYINDVILIKYVQNVSSLTLFFLNYDYLNTIDTIAILPYVKY